MIRAKFPGTVAATYVESFQNVQAKQAVLRVLDTSSIEMWIKHPGELIMAQPDEITILPGMAGQAAGRVEIPISALATGADQTSFVWVIDEAAGTAAKRQVEVGRATPRGVLVEGLEAGEWIATAGASTLVEGQKVRLLGVDAGSAG